MVHTYYDNLKVSRTAPQEVIRAAYKSLAQKYHPDRNQGNNEAVRIMKLINEAYEVLSDPIKRAEHDQWIERQEKNNFKNMQEDKFDSFKKSSKDSTRKNNVQESKKFAGFWRRLLAFIIDYIFIAFVVMGFALIFRMDLQYSDGDVLISLFGIIVGWLYWATLESSKYQATLGKMALGIKVTDLNGGRINFGKATGRFFSRIFSNLTFGIGYLMAAFTKNKQGLHDIIANCLVVDKKFEIQQSISKSSSGIIKFFAAFVICVFIIGVLMAISIPAYRDYIERSKPEQVEVQNIEQVEQYQDIESNSQLPSTITTVDSQSDFEYFQPQIQNTTASDYKFKSVEAFKAIYEASSKEDYNADWVYLASNKSDTWLIDKNNIMHQSNDRYFSTMAVGTILSNGARSWEGYVGYISHVNCSTQQFVNYREVVFNSVGELVSDKTYQYPKWESQAYSEYVHNAVDFVCN